MSIGSSSKQSKTNLKNGSEQAEPEMEHLTSRKKRLEVKKARIYETIDSRRFWEPFSTKSSHLL